MEQITCGQANSSSGGQKIPHISRKYYRIHNRLPLLQILRQINSVSAFPYFFCDINFGL
jgi:hypothetical protein